MDKEELKEILETLRAQGVSAELCTKPVAVSLTSVPCGNPTDLGDQSIDDYFLMPKSLVGLHPEMFIPPVGDSMIDAGYEEGDMLRVRFGVKVNDCDDVLVTINGMVTVKTLFTAEDGTKWLVPRNEKYDAIELTEDMDVRIMGRVVGVEKASVHASSRQLQTTIRRTKNKQRKAQRLSAEAVDGRIIAIGESVRHARQWFAVYRAMVDYCVTPEGDFSGFCTRVRRLLPEHGHLPEAKEVARMAVQSFSKPVALWQPNNAPVMGSRFRDYQSIAMEMGRLLGSCAE